MIKVGLIPLDSRPCNTSWISELAQIAGIELISYPFIKCGNLHNGAALDEQLLWIDENYNNLDYLIISADGLCSGGLVQARLGQINLAEVTAKISLISKLKTSNPKLRIYIFDTLMRTTTTAKDTRSAFYSGKVHEYCLYSGKVYFYNQEEDKIKLLQLENEIPKDILEPYLNARKIKHELNKLFIDYIDKGFIDYLILLQEDSMPLGIHKIEQEKLNELIKNNSNQDKINIYNGTDEGGVILLGKIALETLNLKPNLYLLLPNDNVLDHVMLFEDRPFNINLDKMVETLNMKFVSDINKADFILAIYAEYENKNLDLSSTELVNPIKDESYNNFINMLNSYLSKGKKVCFVDLLFPNGGSDVLLNDIDYKKLTCYSAWNTASNSLGSALSNIACYLKGEIDNKADYDHLNSIFNKERILDDCLYQYISRRNYNQMAIENGINIFNLQDNTEGAEFILQTSLKTLGKKYFTDDFILTLPWNRTFEALIKIKKG